MLKLLVCCLFPPCLTNVPEPILDQTPIVLVAENTIAPETLKLIKRSSAPLRSLDVHKPTTKLALELVGVDNPTIAKTVQFIVDGMLPFFPLHRTKPIPDTLRKRALGTRGAQVIKARLPSARATGSIAKLVGPIGYPSTVGTLVQMLACARSPGGLVTAAKDAATGLVGLI